MVDQVTSIADVIVPEFFTPYVQEASTNVNAFFRSGIVEAVPGLTFGEGGQLIHLPFWKPLTERAQLLDDNHDLEIRKIGSGQDKALQHRRGLVYGATDLASALAGSDPMKAVAAQIGENWSLEFNHVLLASLVGAMGSLGHESPSVNTLDISGLGSTAADFTGHSFIDALQTLGDMKDKIAGIAVHSATDSSLAKQGLITVLQDYLGQPVLRTFMGKPIIIDDVLAPASGGIYTSYLFVRGAVAFAEGTNVKVPTEVHRNPLKSGGREYLVNRRHFVYHPRGIAWTPQSGVPALETASDAEMSDYRNWTRVYEPKNIGIIRFVHKLV